MKITYLIRTIASVGLFLRSSATYASALFGFSLLLFPFLAVGQTPVVMSFQEGVGGYAGTTDVTINNQYIKYGGNGVTSRGELNPVFGTTTYDQRSLLAFKNLTVPAGARVVKATLELRVVCQYTTGSRPVAYYVIPGWNEKGQIGWRTRDTSLAWPVLGAYGPGTGTRADLNVPFPQMKAIGDQPVSLPLNPAAVQQWIDNPAGNAGLLFMNPVPGNMTWVASYRNPVIAKRPRLVLELAASSSTPTPDTKAPTVSLLTPLPGAQAVGDLQLEASASDASGLAWVELLVDGEPVGGRITAPPYRMTASTLSWPNGPHTVAARARDKAGNEAVSAPVSVLVNNPAPVTSLFAPPMRTGTLEVKLMPTAAVSAGKPVLVTFGLPLPRGSLAPSELNLIRVLDGGGEVTAFVEMLTPWRHARDSALDQKSVRVARIQIWHTFHGTAAEPVTVQWGSTPRAKSSPALLDPKSAWHPVVDADFTAGDDVFEPDVYALLPAHFLAKGVLTLAPSQPFDPSVTELRSDPAQLLAAGLTGDIAFQQAAKNFFYTNINKDDSRVAAANKNPYRTDSEPWLFDRSCAMYNLYGQSGFYTALRQAVRNSQFYAAHLYPDSVIPATAAGLFKLKHPVPSVGASGNTTMYSYNENLAYTYWLTGDDDMLPLIRSVALAQRIHGDPVRWSPSIGVWTERHTAFRLLAETVFYEVTGDSVARQNLQTGMNDLIWHQNGAGGQLPANRVDGGFYHTATQHSEPGGSAIIASPWMSALLMKPIMRAHGVTSDQGTAQMMPRLARFLAAASRTDASHTYTTTKAALRYPDYLTYANGAPQVRSASDAEHSLDVTAAVALGYYFSEQLGSPDLELRAAATELLTTTEVGFKYWTRPSAPASGATAYRMTPWRKYGWQFSGSGHLTWLMK